MEWPNIEEIITYVEEKFPIRTNTHYALHQSTEDQLSELKHALRNKGIEITKKSCEAFHKINQDKDDICLYCGEPINADF